MAIGLKNLPDIQAIDSDYPDGQIKDDSVPGSFDGTEVNKRAYADMHQFFAKIMREAGIEPNGIFDNEYSGNQYWEAFVENKLKKPIGIDICNNGHTVTSSTGEWALPFQDTNVDLLGEYNISLLKFTPKTPGYYSVCINGSFSWVTIPGSPINFQLFLRKNGSFYPNQIELTPATAGLQYPVSLNKIIYMNGNTDYLIPMVQQDQAHQMIFVGNFTASYLGK